MTFWFQFFKHPHTHEGTLKPRNINKSQPHAQLVMTKLDSHFQVPTFIGFRMGQQQGQTQDLPKWHTQFPSTPNHQKRVNESIWSPWGLTMSSPTPCRTKGTQQSCTRQALDKKSPGGCSTVKIFFFTGQVLLLLTYCKVYTWVHDMYIVNSTLDSL